MPEPGRTRRAELAVPPDFEVLRARAVVDPPAAGVAERVRQLWDERQEDTRVLNTMADLLLSLGRRVQTLERTVRRLQRAGRARR